MSPDIVLGQTPLAWSTPVWSGFLVHQQIGARFPQIGKSFVWPGPSILFHFTSAIVIRERSLDLECWTLGASFTRHSSLITRHSPKLEKVEFVDKVDEVDKVDGLASPETRLAF
jgi:hypothetical protein